MERKKYLSTTLMGIGAALSSGFRWNSYQTHLVYTAATRSLAMLEVAMHLDLTQDLPSDRYFVEIDIPDEIEMIELSMDELPSSWDAKPPILATQFIGDDFTSSLAAAVLKVPSSIIHQEFNYLINPKHPDARAISVLSTQPFVFDNRLPSS